MARLTGRKTKHPGIRDLGSGRYALRITITDPKTGKRRDLSRTVEARSLTEALDLKIKIAREAGGALPSPSKREKLGAVALAWLDRKASQRRPDGSTRLTPASIHAYRYAVEHLIGPTIGELYIDAVTRSDVEAWRDTLAESFATSSVNAGLRCLKAILRDRDMTVADRVSALEVDDTRITEDEPNLLSEEQLQRFIASVRATTPAQAALILVMFTTGARISTVLALEWTDVDPEAGTITFRRRLSRGEVIPGVKRSRTAVDVAPLLPEVWAELVAHRAGFSEVMHASGLCFPTSTGRHIERGHVDRAFRRAREHAGIDIRLTPHAARRTAATLLRRAAGSVVAKAVVGHTSDRMHEHYSRVDVPEKVRAAREAFRVIQGGEVSSIGVAQSETIENVEPSVALSGVSEA